MLNKNRGANSDSLQQMNRSLVLSLMRKSHITTRADIVKKTGLKGATITNIVADFIKAGIIIETGSVEGEKGRRSIGISLDNDIYQIIAVRISRLNFKIRIYSLHGENLYGKSFEIDTNSDVKGIIDSIKLRIQEFLTVFPRKTLAIGIALPGPYMKSKNSILQISDFHGWEGINIAEEIESEFMIPTAVEHDAKSSALAEWWYGSYEHTSSILLNIIAGQGNGVGVISNGKILSGAHGTAGELGHCSIFFDGPLCDCGNHGCLDLYCSSRILKKNVKEKIKDMPDYYLFDKQINEETLASAVQKGDSLVIEEVRKISKYLGYGIVNAINIYDPDLIVIGDELANIGKNILLDEIRTIINERVLPGLSGEVKIVLSKLQEPILLGAMTVAMDKVFHEMKFMEKEISKEEKV